MKLQRKRLQLIFNPSAGAAREDSVDILELIHEMQKWHLIPEVFLIEEACDLPGAIDDALNDGIDLFVACGGDGTIASVAHALRKKNATLGLISSGTRNNIALSLGIPLTVPEAVACLRTGRAIQVDGGRFTLSPSITPSPGITPSPAQNVDPAQAMPFIELCSVGLGSALFSPVDDIQHGDISRIGDLLSTLIASPPAEITLRLDDNVTVNGIGHVILVSNMPYGGNNYPMGPNVAFNDGMLDVLLFADLTKIELLAHAVRSESDADIWKDPRIQRYQVRQVQIDTNPPMPVMVDGIVVGEGNALIEAVPNQWKIMVPGESEPRPAEEQA